jgi:VIT1/CCC1 family predicted Fe2+/Mn2+ transporter
MGQQRRNRRVRVDMSASSTRIRDDYEKYKFINFIMAMISVFSLMLPVFFYLDGLVVTVAVMILVFGLMNPYYDAKYSFRFSNTLRRSV